MERYAHPEVLVTTDWVAKHATGNRNADKIRLVEVNVDQSLYKSGHIPGAVGWSWKTQLSDTVRRDILSREDFSLLMQQSGIARDTTVILYGDSNNWFAAWAFWQMKMYGHNDVRMMDGGRKKWESENRPMTTDKAVITLTPYNAPEADNSLRAFLPEVQKNIADNTRRDAATTVELVDVRSPQEFSGEVLAPPGLPETCQRGGHIPGASNIPWSQAVQDDGTFKPADQLRSLYKDAGITGTRPVITYCRIGERSSHSWFALKYLLGYDPIKNYDGSWTEWGNLVGADIETGPARKEPV